jgi:hypothetical protein
VSPGPRQTTIIPIETETIRHTDTEEVVTTSRDSAADDEGFTVQTTPSSLSSSTRRGSVLFPRRPPLTGSGAGFTRPAVGAARSTTVSTPLTAVVPNIRKFQDIFSRRRSTTPPSSLGGEDTPMAVEEEGAEEVKEEGEEVDEAEASRLANEGSLASTAAQGKIIYSKVYSRQMGG